MYLAYWADWYRSRNTILLVIGSWWCIIFKTVLINHFISYKQNIGKDCIVSVPFDIRRSSSIDGQLVSQDIFAKPFVNFISSSGNFIGHALASDSSIPSIQGKIKNSFRFYLTAEFSNPFKYFLFVLIIS